jgi:ribosomal protein S18 acetylase RimI-like enzyme
MVAHAIDGHKGFSGLRRLEPGKDLRDVANLIAEAFGNELDATGRAILREMRVLSYLGLLFPSSFNEGWGFGETFLGFVWVEDGHIVGNVNVYPSQIGSRRWLISNVAVGKAYQRQGIGRALMAVAIDEARRCGGQTVVLQVRADNAPAVHIYESLGFRQVAATTYLQLDSVPPVSPSTPPGVILRQRRLGEGDAIFSLARISAPRRPQWEPPLRREDFQLSWYNSLSEGLHRLFGGPDIHRLVAEAKGRLVGAMVVRRAGWLSPSHHLDMRVHPDYQGQLETVLISHGLALLSRRPDRSTLAQHPAEHREGVAAFRVFGFREVRTLAWMELELRF